MNIEYEVTFPKVDKADVRDKLKKAGAHLSKPEFLQKRTTFNLPNKNNKEHTWVRVRDEGGKITLSIKTVDGKQIHDQKEICLEVDDYKKAVELLIKIGCLEKAYQETKREIWMLDNVEIAIDEWPYLEPFIEIEGSSEDKVKSACKKLDFDYKEAIIGAVDVLYSQKYNISSDRINNHTPLITFSAPNPFK
jgi:adenylate cyclase class 2